MSHFFKSSLTSTIAVFNEKNQVLVIERKNFPFQGCWALPGGFLNEGETFLDAAVRELREETGLVISAFKFIDLSVRDEVDRDPRGRVVDMSFAVVLDYTPEVTANDDATDFMWRNWSAGLAFDHDSVLFEASRYTD